MLNHDTQQFFQSLRQEICSFLENADGTARFRHDSWQHHESGGGITGALEHGALFEKAGVNFSAITSQLSGKLANALATPPQRIFATGISVIIHPQSPMVPTIHMNLRYLELENGSAWFGGGIDLTPYYLFEDDARLFHRKLKNVCDAFDPTFYAHFKEACDTYFFIKHRNETRGIGGIFFDYLQHDPINLFAFVQRLGKTFPELYGEILEKRKHEPWGPEEKAWQLHRRGRYVEFNLVYDRGTLFGLETKGRTESILISLPPAVSWSYNSQPKPGSREEQLITILQHPKDWIHS